MTKFIGTTSTSCFFIGKDNQCTNNMAEAIHFDTIGDCMRACIKMNELFGKPVFKTQMINV